MTDYYTDYLNEELQIIDNIFCNQCFNKSNIEWQYEVEKIFQQDNIHKFTELQHKSSSYLHYKAEEIAYKYHINLKEEFKQYE